MKRKCLYLLICLSSGLANLAAQQPGRPAKDTIRDNSIAPPENLNEQLATLLHDWQLDFSKSKMQCSQGANVVYHDSVYTSCLFNLPSEMELSYNQVVRSYIDMYANRKRELVSYMLALGGYYFPMFEEALDRYGLPLELKYLPVIESALNPVAVSRMGATGLWQFMLKTGKGYGLEVNSLVDERRDPYKATDAAARYLRDLFAIYGDWNLVIAAYNCGPGNVNKAIARSGGKSDYWQIYYGLPRETRGYVPAFIAANYIMNYYPKHNICPMESFAAMTALDTIHVNNEMHFSQISGVLDIPVDEIRRLNPQFKKDIIPGNYRSYALVLPTSKTVAFIDKKNEISGYRRNEYLSHRANTDEFVRGADAASGNYSSANVYYRVRSGDNLSKIAQRNGVTVEQLKSWNGLRSTKLSVGKSLIVKKQKVAAAPAPKSEPELAQKNKAEPDTAAVNPQSGGNVVAQHPDRQMDSPKGGDHAGGPAETAGATPENTVKTEYYHVRNGDNLSKIAQRNGITVEQLKSWNGLKSTKLSIGKRLIVKKEKEVAAPGSKSASGMANGDAVVADEQPGTNSAGSIISQYIKEQLEKTEQAVSEDADVK